MRTRTRRRRRARGSVRARGRGRARDRNRRRRPSEKRVGLCGGDGGSYVVILTEAGNKTPGPRAQRQLTAARGEGGATERAGGSPLESVRSSPRRAHEGRLRYVARGPARGSQPRGTIVRRARARPLQPTRPSAQDSKRLTTRRWNQYKTSRRQRPTEPQRARAWRCTTPARHRRTQRSSACATRESYRVGQVIQGWEEGGRG